MANFEEVKSIISKKVDRASIPPRILLSRFQFIDDQSRYSRACLDPYYMPFYYHLGANYPVDNLLEIGFGLGLNAACYLMGSPNTENYLAIQQPPEEFYSTRMGIANIKKSWRKPFEVKTAMVYDEWFLDRMRSKKWDLVLIGDKAEYDTHLLWLNTVWESLRDGGVICMDYTTSHDQAKRAYRDFCIIKNRDSFVFSTRYGAGTIIK